MQLLPVRGEPLRDRIVLGLALVHAVHRRALSAPVLFLSSSRLVSLLLPSCFSPPLSLVFCCPPVILHLSLGLGLFLCALEVFCSATAGIFCLLLFLRRQCGRGSELLQGINIGRSRHDGDERERVAVIFDYVFIICACPLYSVRSLTNLGLISRFQILCRRFGFWHEKKICGVLSKTLCSGWASWLLL
ncbi:hypothetical protein EDB19DRAFT_1744489 [Suillus lakei]|nr:hypothetical protein EDB19DRAFT_1744489 [Suillus lakei]